MAPQIGRSILARAVLEEVEQHPLIAADAGELRVVDAEARLQPEAIYGHFTRFFAH